MNYALIRDGVVENVIVADAQFVATLTGYDHIEALDTPEEQKVAGPGWLYDAETGLFSAPEQTALPEIVVTNVATDNPAAIIQPGDVTVPVGTAVTVTAELRGPDGSVLPVDATFRMPFAARDGRERILLAQFVQGVAIIGTTVSESGCWQISEAMINRDLPPEQHMRFAGLSIYAVQ